MDVTLKKQVDEEISKMEADFKAYKLDMAAKKKALQPRDPSPPAVNQPGSNGGKELVHHFQQKEDETKAIQMTTKYRQVQAETSKLLGDVKAVDTEIQGEDPQEEKTEDSSGGQHLVNHRQHKGETRAKLWAHYVQPSTPPLSGLVCAR